MNDFGIKQLIIDPSRVTITASTTVDLVFANSPQRVADSGAFV